MENFGSSLKQESTLLNPLYVSVVSVLLFSYFLVKWLVCPPTTTHKNPPPAPPKLPILGNLLQIGLYPHRTLLSLAHRYGPLMLLHLGSVPVLIVTSAEAALEIMKTHDIIFSGRPKLKIAMKLLYNCKDVSAAPYGEYWRRMKSVYVLHLLSNKRVHSFRAVREEEVAIFVKKIQQLSASSLPVNLSEMLASLTNDVVCRVAFGRKYGEEGDGGKRFKELLGEFMSLLGDFTAGDFIPWLAWVNCVNGFNARAEKTAKEFDQFLDGIVEEHMNSRERKRNSDESAHVKEDPKDFVDVLLELQENGLDDQFSLERENIKALILDVFVGGTDTSYTVLEWAMTELIRHPRVMKELQNEVRGVSPEKSEISEADLDKMPYLKLVFKETLRLHPPIPLLGPRESIQDAKIMGYDIANGTMVLINGWALGRDPKTWSRPEDFWPERFLNSCVDFRGHDFQFIPFGAGRRGCPGVSFAMAVDELALANLVKSFDWELPGGAKLEELDTTECIGMTTHRKNPLLAVAIPFS